MSPNSVIILNETRMPFLYSEATEEFRAKVQAIEDRSDECYKLLRLLYRPKNAARWGLLTAMSLQLETMQQKYGRNSPPHLIRMITLDRCTCGFKFISEHGKPESKLAEKYTWNGSMIEDANHALRISEHYTHFLNIFPMWHKNHERIDLLSDDKVRFYMPGDSPRQRQVNAYQQKFRMTESEDQPTENAKPESPVAMRLLGDLVRAVRPIAAQKKFAYEPSRELIEALRPKYQDRMDERFRHPDSFQLDGYSLREFKSFYIALLILCSIHDYLCYPTIQYGLPIPTSSLVMVKTRATWIARLTAISGLPQSTCEKIVSDLTLDAVGQPGSSMCIHPFVPLDSVTLAVAPQFPLASLADDNVVRAFSYTSPALFSAQNTQKEAAMKTRISDVARQYSVNYSIELPDGSTEIDLLLEHEASSTVVMAELKWIRKPNRTVERISRDKEVEKGISQLRLIRAYARGNPDFLKAKGKLARSLADYANVHYLLVVRDHWFWVDPEDRIALVDFDAFLPALKSSTNLQETIATLLTYEWLPVEGRDFNVEYATASVYGMMLESPEFKPTR
jgi:hypothetical protein